MNDRWCVRCGRTDPTPYLRKYARLLLGKAGNRVLDLGCGNGKLVTVCLIWAGATEEMLGTCSTSEQLSLPLMPVLMSQMFVHVCWGTIYCRAL